MTTLAGRFELSEPLGPSHRGVSRAVDTTTGDEVVVKELTLGRLQDWKQLDLFRREAKALAQLDHPGVPKFVDSFDDDGGGEPRFYVVQSYVAGRSVAEAIEAADLNDEETLKELVVGVLEVLEYLQSFSPPVIHRDIKPENIIMRPDGGVALVDFGTVAVQLEGTTGGSTVVGTSGYMAPEQLVGRAVPASDLFGLGATLVHALTRIHPADLPVERMKLQWRERALFGGSRFLDFVDSLVEPLPARRPPDAASASRRLGSGGTTSITRRDDTILASRPATTDIQLRRTRTRLRIDFGKQRGKAVFHKLYAVALFSAVPGFVVATVLHVSPVLPVLGSIAVGVAITFAVIKRGAARRNPLLELDADRGFRLKCQDTSYQMKTGSLDEVAGPDVGYGSRARSFFLATRGKTYELSNACSAAEQEWLADEIASFLNEHTA